MRTTDVPDISIFLPPTLTYDAQETLVTRIIHTSNRAVVFSTLFIAASFGILREFHTANFTFLLAV